MINPIWTRFRLGFDPQSPKLGLVGCGWPSRSTTRVKLGSSSLPYVKFIEFKPKMYLICMNPIWSQFWIGLGPEGPNSAQVGHDFGLNSGRVGEGRESKVFVELFYGHFQFSFHFISKYKIQKALNFSPEMFNFEYGQNFGSFCFFSFCKAKIIFFLFNIYSTEFILD